MRRTGGARRARGRRRNAQCTECNGTCAERRSCGLRCACSDVCAQCPARGVHVVQNAIACPTRPVPLRSFRVRVWTFSSAVRRSSYNFFSMTDLHRSSAESGQGGGRGEGAGLRTGGRQGRTEAKACGSARINARSCLWVQRVDRSLRGGGLLFGQTATRAGAHPDTERQTPGRIHNTT